MNTLNYLLAGYVCFFAILSLFIFRMDRKTDRLIREIDELKKFKSRD